MAADKRGYGKYVVDNAEVLGAVVSMRQTRATHKKEEARLRKAEKVNQRITTLPVSRERRVMASQMFAASKLAYGWIGHKPNKAESDKSFNTALRGIHKTSNKFESKNLKAVMEGAVTDPKCIITTRLAGIVTRAIQRGNGKWMSGKGTLSGNLGSCMDDLGWKENG